MKNLRFGAFDSFISEAKMKISFIMFMVDEKFIQVFQYLVSKDYLLIDFIITKFQMFVFLCVFQFNDSVWCEIQ